MAKKNGYPSKKTLFISIFTENEHKYLTKLRETKDKLFLHACKVLTKWKIKPEHISLLSFLQIIPFIFFFPFLPWLSFIFLLLSFFFDALDGALARYQQNNKAVGQFIDIASDNFFFFGVILSFIYFKTIDGFWGSFYLFNYVFLIIFALAIKLFQGQLFYIVRSKYYFYLVFLVFLLTGKNYFDPFLVLLSIYMFVTNLFLFHKARCLISLH